MNRLHPALAAACFSIFAATAMAQAPAADAGKPMGGHHRMKSCSQEADPAKCEASRKEMRERFTAARAACKDQADRRGCMTEQFCAKSQDPGKCQAQAKERQARTSKRMDERQAAHEACTGKRGDELKTCLHAQRGKSGYGRHRSQGSHGSSDKT
jgi:hypothetical protein